MIRLLPLSCLSALLLCLMPACDSQNSATADGATAPPLTPAQGVEAVLKPELLPEAKPTDAPSQEPGEMPGQAEVFDGLGVGATPEDIKPGERAMYGKKAFALTMEPLSLKEAIVKAEQGEGPYKVSTTIEKVCQKKGCWFTLKEEGVSIPIRVRMKDYAFFIPKNAEAMPVLTEGTFRKTTLSQEMAQHYADDEAQTTGKPARKVTGPELTYEFTATVVEIQAPKG